MDWFERVVFIVMFIVLCMVFGITWFSIEKMNKEFVKQKIPTMQQLEKSMKNK